MADRGAKCWKRREILKQMAVASTVMMVQGNGIRTKGDARGAERDFEIQVASISAQTLRLSVLPVANGRVSGVPMNGSLAQRSWGTVVAKLRGESRAQTVKLGDLSVGIS